MNTVFQKSRSAGFFRHTIVPATALILSAASWPAVSGVTLHSGQSYATLDYYVQAWYQSRGYTSSTDSAGLNNFFLRRNRIVLSGQYNNYIGFFVDTDAPVDGEQGYNNRSMYYEDAYVTLDASDAYRFIVGKFKIPFTRENLEDCFGPLTMDRAEVLAYTPFVASRDTGVAMWGNLHNAVYQYRVMLSNGRQGDGVPKSEPMVTGRITASLLDPEYGYGYEGTYLGTMKVLTFGASYEYQPDVVWNDYTTQTDAKNYEAWTTDVFFEYPFRSGTYTASAAYMHYGTGNAINSAYPDPNLPVTSQLSGYYVKAGYMLPTKVGIGRLQFFLRHETSRYHLLSGFDDQQWNSAGFNYYISGQQLKVSGEFARITFNKQDPLNPSLQNYNQATLGLQLLF